MNKKPNIVRTESLENLVNAFAAHLEAEKLRGLILHRVDCEANRNHCKVSVKWGKSWIKVDVGGSGNFMVDAAGDIFGIKAYGVPHLGHHYGNLETIYAWDWAAGHSYAVRKETPEAKSESPVARPMKSWEETSIQNCIDSAKVPTPAHLLPRAASHIPPVPCRKEPAELTEAKLDAMIADKKIPTLAETHEARSKVPEVPAHVPSPCPNLTRFYFWDMNGKPLLRFNSDPAAIGLATDIFAINAQDAARLVSALLANACPSWALLIDKASGREFQMTWRTR